MIIGLDGREHDADALALARTLWTALGGRQLVAHVVPPPPLGRGMTEYAIEARRDGRELLARAADKCGDSAQTRLLETWPVDLALNQLADDYEAPMIVLASSHRGAVGRIVPGGVASRLLAHATCPIAVAPVGYASNARPIVRLGVAYDGTRESDLALELAADSATRLGVPLRLYHAMHPVSRDPASDALRENMRQIAQGIVDAGVNRLPAEVEATSSVVEGDAAVVAEAAREDSIDLLYIGSRGYGPLREATFGGFVGALLPAAGCSLVIVPRNTPLASNA